MLKKVLDIPSQFQATRCVEVYIEKKVHHVIGFSLPVLQNIQSKLYTRLLTQGSENFDVESPDLSLMNLNEDYPHNFDGHQMSHYSKADDFYNNQSEFHISVGYSLRTPTCEIVGPSFRTLNFESNYEFNSRNPRETMPIDEGDINPIERWVRVEDNTGDVIADSADAEHAEDLLEEADDEEAMIGGSDSNEEGETLG